MAENLIAENDFNLFSQPDTELKAALDKMRQSVGLLINALQSTESENAWLKNKVTELEKVYEQVKDKEKLEARVKELEINEQNITYVHEELSRKNHELNSKEEEIHKLKDNISMLESRIIELENELSEHAETRLQGVSIEEVIQYKEAIESFKRLVEEKELLVHNLNHRNEELQNSFNESVKMSESLDAELLSMRTFNDKILSELKDEQRNKMMNDSKNKLIEDLKEQLNSISSQSIEKENAIEELSNKYADLLEENKLLKDSTGDKDFYSKQAEGLQEQVKTANNELIIKNNQINELRSKLDEQIESIAEKEHEIGKLSERLEKYKHQSEDSEETKTDLSAFKEKYLETCNEIGALKAKNIVLEKKISEVNEEIRKRNQEKLLLNTKLETCIQRVEKMMGAN